MAIKVSPQCGGEPGAVRPVTCDMPLLQMLQQAAAASTDLDSLHKMLASDLETNFLHSSIPWDNPALQIEVILIFALLPRCTWKPNFGCEIIPYWICITYGSHYRFWGLFCPLHLAILLSNYKATVWLMDRFYTQLPAMGGDETSQTAGARYIADMGEVLEAQLHAVHQTLNTEPKVVNEVVKSTPYVFS